MNSPKILLITFSNISDHQDKVAVLYEELLRMGADAYMMLPKDIDIKCEHSGRTYFVDCPSRPGIAKGTFNAKNLLHVINIIKRGHFDAILFETLHVWNLPIMILSGKTRVYQMIHDVIPHGGDKGAKQVDLMNKTVISMADGIVICNKKYKKALCQRYNANPKKVKCIELFERYPEYKAPKRNGHMLFFGRLNPYKGADNLLQIVKLCPDVKFDVVGKADPLVADIIEELKKYKNVNVNEGYIPDEEIASIFDSCEWSILPYNSATQSGVVVESYKNSKPVICFDVGAITEQVVDGKTGFLIKEKDITAFSNKIKEALQLSDEEYKVFCKNGYEFGYNQFSPKKAASKILKIMTSEIS